MEHAAPARWVGDMKLRDITDAIGGGDKPTLRRAFRSLVSIPREAEIETPSPGLLVVALNRLCAVLNGDGAEMPSETCAALALPAGATFGQGAVAAKREWTRLSRLIVEEG